jgi:hypothetical protein
MSNSTNEKLLVSVLADYGDLHDLAFAEVTQQLYAELEGIECDIQTYAVPAFDTVATGFALGQLARNSRLGSRHKFFVNTAPRKDDLQPRVKSAGEGFAYAKLPNGVEIGVVNSGYSMSFLKDIATELRAVNCSKEGSQFRSRDVFPPAFARIVRGDFSELGDDLMDAIPDPKKSAVCYTDGYGNLKTSIDSASLKDMMGKEVVIDINGRKNVAKITEGIFGVADGQLCLAPGSSGWKVNGTPFRFTEVVLRGGSAAKAFSFPKGGDELQWSLT